MTVVTFIIEEEQERERIDKALSTFASRLVTLHKFSNWYNRWSF